MNGYISPIGEYIDCDKYFETHDCPMGLIHFEWCMQHNVDEDDLLNDGYVKLTNCLRPYIFMGRHLTPEQVCKLREFEIEPDEFDL